MVNSHEDAAAAILGRVLDQVAEDFIKVLPLDRDLRPSVYRRLFDATWEQMNDRARENDPPAES